MALYNIVLIPVVNRALQPTARTRHCTIIFPMVLAVVVVRHGEVTPYSTALLLLHAVGPYIIIWYLLARDDFGLGARFGRSPCGYCIALHYNNNGGGSGFGAANAASWVLRPTVKQTKHPPYPCFILTNWVKPHESESATQRIKGDSPPGTIKA